MFFYSPPDRTDVLRILQLNNLPTADLSEMNMANFIECSVEDETLAVVGIEVHGSDGLLRSLAVMPQAQGMGYGNALVEKIEALAKDRNVNTLYLLTETAEHFFKRFGYEKIDRDLAPASIAMTNQFSELCPSDAAFMMKRLVRSP